MAMFCVHISGKCMVHRREEEMNLLKFSGKKIFDIGDIIMYSWPPSRPNGYAMNRRTASQKNVQTHCVSGEELTGALFCC